MQRINTKPTKKPRNVWNIMFARNVLSCKESEREREMRLFTRCKCRPTQNNSVAYDMWNWQENQAQVKYHKKTWGERKSILYSIDADFFSLYSLSFTSISLLSLLLRPQSNNTHVRETRDAVSTVRSNVDYLMHCTICRRSRTHAHIDYSGFALAFNSNQYIIYTIYAFCSITCTELWLFPNT